MVHRIQKGNEDIHRSKQIELRHVLKEPQDLRIFTCMVPCLVEHRRGIVNTDRVVASLTEFRRYQTGSAAEVTQKELSSLTVTFGLAKTLRDKVDKVCPLRRVQILLEAIVISC